MVLHYYSTTHFGRRYNSKVTETDGFISCKHIFILEEGYGIKAFTVQNLYFHYGAVITACVFLEFNEAYCESRMLVCLQNFTEVVGHHLVSAVEIGNLKLKDWKFGFGTETACRFGNACVGALKSVHVGLSQDFHRVFLSR